MEREPQRRTRTHRSTTRANPCFFDIPFRSPATDELERPRGVVQRTMHRGLFAIGGSLGDEAILHRSHGDPGFQHDWEHASDTAQASAALPATAMDKEEHRSRLVRLGFPKMKH